MTTLVGGLVRSLGSVAQSLSRASPWVLRGCGSGAASTGGRSLTASNEPAVTWTPLLTPVRFRYHSEKVARGPLIKNYGYKETLWNKGNLSTYFQCSLTIAYGNKWTIIDLIVYVRRLMLH